MADEQLQAEGTTAKEELDLKRLDEMDDAGEGHIYLTFTEYGDVQYDSFKEMVLGTKSFCDEKGIPYPAGGLIDGNYYDSYEDEEEYNADWDSMDDLIGR